MKHVFLVALALVTALASASAPSTVSAQSSNDRAAAYELYQEGVQAYKNEEYEQAADHLEEAAEIHKNPVVYYNLSLAYSKLGRVEDALDAAEVASSMDQDMPPDTATKNQARIRSFQAVIASTSIAESVSMERARAASAPRPETDISTVGWAGAAGAGVGASLIGAALIMNGSIGRKIDNYEAALDAGELNSANRLYDEIDRQQTVASVTLLSGSALLLAGTGMLMYDLFYLEESPRARLGASFGPNSAAVDLRIRF